MIWKALIAAAVVVVGYLEILLWANLSEKAQYWTSGVVVGALLGALGMRMLAESEGAPPAKGRNFMLLLAGIAIFLWLTDLYIYYVVVFAIYANVMVAMALATWAENAIEAAMLRKKVQPSNRGDAE